MQRWFLKILTSIALALFLATPALKAQISTHRLKQADSLFTSKRYTQSLDFYRDILGQHEYTPAMLLKMAYIEEGLQQTGPALYYLSLYYQVTKEPEALEKMDELAAKYRLEGYARADSDWFLNLYYDQHFRISILTGAFLIFILSITAYTKRKKQPIVAPLVLFGLFTIVLLVHLNLGVEKSSAIVAQSQTYLMNGPSAGASVVGVIDGGHKVTIVGKKDVWVEIEWHGSPAYIKEKDLLPLVL